MLTTLYNVGFCPCAALTEPQDPHILRAIGRTWAWRRRLEAGEFSTVEELAASVGLGERHVNRLLRLAYLSPELQKRLTCGREATAISLHDLCFLADEAWDHQVAKAFAGNSGCWESLLDHLQHCWQVSNMPIH